MHAPDLGGTSASDRARVALDAPVNGAAGFAPESDGCNLFQIWEQLYQFAPILLNPKQYNKTYC